MPKPPEGGQKKIKSGAGLFRTILQSGGVEFNYNQVIDPFYLKKHIENKLYDGALQGEFIAGMGEFLQDNDALRFCLSSPPLNEAHMSSSVYDSLMKIFLNVECLQPKLIEILLEKLPEYVNIDEGVYNEHFPRLILSQFRWLDRIVDCRRLADKLLEVLAVCTPQLKKDLISFIPDIIDDSHHGLVVEALIMQMNEDSQLITPIIDCYSNLNLPGSLMMEVQELVLKKLNSASVDDLPVMVGFLLQSVTQSDAQEVVKKLRLGLDFDSTTLLNDTTSSSQSSSRRKANKMGLTLTLEAIKSAIRFKKDLLKAFLKQIESIESCMKHTVLDMWVLYIMHSMVPHRKLVEALFKRKITSGQFTHTLMMKSVCNHADSLRDYFREMVALAEGFLRAAESSVRKFGVGLYIAVFEAFTDKVQRQNTLGSVVTHIGSGVETEINGALDVLSILSREVAVLLPFSTFIKGLLEYIDGLKDSQLRCLFDVFASIAFITSAPSSSSSSLQKQRSAPFLKPNNLVHDDLQIFIRKQLVHSDIKYKRIGIIGAVCLIRRIGAKAVADANKEYAEKLPDELLDRAMSLFELVFRNCDNVQMCMAFFYDEVVSAAYGYSFSLQIMEYIANKLEEELHTRFILDIDSDLTEQLWMNIDLQKATIAVNMYPLAETTESQDTLLSLAPQFRLLQLCYRALHDNSLYSIDGLLGCPIALFPSSDLLDFAHQSKQEAICLSLYYAINWFREVVNAFSVVDDPDIKMKVLQRLHHIIDLEQKLEDCLAIYSGFVLPHHIFWADIKKGQIFNNKQAMASKGRKAKPAGGISSLGDIVPHVSLLRPYFRQFDICVMKIVAYTFEADTLNSQPNPTLIELEPSTLHYLLVDISQKLTCLSVTKRFFGHSSAEPVPCLIPYSPEDIICGVGEIFPALCIHLERISDSLLALNSKIEENLGDGVDNAEKDENGVEKERSSLLESFILILQSFEKVFGYEGLPQHEDLIMSILSKIPLCANSSLAKAQQELLDYFLQRFTTTILETSDFNLCLPFVALLGSIARNKQGLEHSRERVSKLAGQFLKHSWKYGKLKAKSISLLLEKYVEFDTRPLKLIKHLSELFKLEQDEDNKQQAEYGTFNAKTFPHYYTAVLSSLISIFCNTEFKDDVCLMLKTMAQLSELFNALLQATKQDEVPLGVLICALKQGKLFVEQFIKHVLPLFGKCFKEKQEECTAILRTVQRGTRIIHALCAHGKLVGAKNANSLLTLIPNVKKMMESFIFAVKEMLDLLGYSNAFSLGNLKHRDLAGEELSSQDPAYTAILTTKSQKKKKRKYEEK